MPKLKFTATAIDNLKVERETLYWDAANKGFGLRVQSTGKKVFICQYTFRGQSRRVTLGELGRGNCTLSSAQKAASRIFGAVAEGRDPAREGRDNLTVEALAEHWLRLHVRPKRKPSTVRDYDELLRNHILPRFGKMQADAVRRAELMALHLELADRPRTANKAVVVVKAMFNFGSTAELLPDGHKNPASGIELYEENSRERFLTGEELGRVGTALAELMATNDVSIYAGNALRLLMLTGCRLNEVLTLKWSFLNLEHGVLELPDTKTGARRVALSAAAVEVLANTPRLKGHPYVFVGQKPGMPLVSLRVPWERVSEQAKIKNCRVHDLRHTFASVGAMGGLSLPMIGKLLGHKVVATTQRYAHLADEASRQANEKVSGEIGRALGLSASADNVVSMRGKS